MLSFLTSCGQPNEYDMPSKNTKTNKKDYLINSPRFNDRSTNRASLGIRDSSALTRFLKSKDAIVPKENEQDGPSTSMQRYKSTEGIRAGINQKMRSINSTSDLSYNSENIPSERVSTNLGQHHSSYKSFNNPSHNMLRHNRLNNQNMSTSLHNRDSSLSINGDKNYWRLDLNDNNKASPIQMNQYYIRGSKNESFSHALQRYTSMGSYKGGSNDVSVDDCVSSVMQEINKGNVSRSSINNSFYHATSMKKMEGDAIVSLRKQIAKYNEEIHALKFVADELTNRINQLSSENFDLKSKKSSVTYKKLECEDLENILEQTKKANYQMRATMNIRKSYSNSSINPSTQPGISSQDIDIASMLTAYQLADKDDPEVSRLLSKVDRYRYMLDRD